MKKQCLKLISACLLSAVALTSCAESTDIAESSEQEESMESAESREEATVDYNYMLGLKSFVPAEGVYAAEGAVASTDNAVLAERVNKLFAKAGKAIALQLDESFAPDGVPSAVLSQAYQITVGETLTVTAASDVGLYYGAMTVSRYLAAQGCMAYGTYLDWPDVAERCLHLDIARKYFTKEQIIDFISSAAAYNINTVELHFSENEGFRIRCDTDPAITSDEYLTKDEVKEILAAAEELYVEIVPSFDSPGHLLQILKVHPEFSLTDTDGYNSPKTLDITNERAVEYIKSLLREYGTLFDGCKSFNIGGDESFGWSNVRRMQFSAWQVLADYSAATYGAGANAHDAFIGYINMVAEFVESMGFKVRAWNDGLARNGEQARVNAPSVDIDVLYWTEGGVLQASPLDTFINSGYSVINVNERYMYYVLKEDYEQPNAEMIFKEWHAGVFASADPRRGFNYVEPEMLTDTVKGAYFCIWCDKPDVQTAEQIADGSRLALRAMAVKAWSSSPNIDYSTFLQQQNQI